MMSIYAPKKHIVLKGGVSEVKIFIDGEPFSPSSPEASTSKNSLLSEIEETILQKGLTYTTITVDGIEMDSSAFTRLRQGREAHFKTCQIKQLLIESLQEAVNYLPRLTDGIKKIASEIERKEHQNINEYLTNFTEGLDWIINVMQKSQSLLGIKDFDLHNKKESMTRLNKSLENITDCFENGRTMEIAFHMRQGVLPEINNISEYIYQLFEAARLNK
jgi:hypothetical protein